MKFNKKLLSFLLIFVILLFIPATSAADMDNVSSSESNDIALSSSSSVADNSAISEDNVATAQVSNSVNFADDISTYSDDLVDYAGGDFSGLKQSIASSGSSAAHVSLSGNVNLANSESSAFSSGINIDKSVTINGAGYTISGTNANGDGVRIFNVNSGANLTLMNIILTAGQAAWGGAINVESGGLLNLVNVTFINNTAFNSSGGAIYSNGLVNGDNCTFINNTAYKSGGAITMGNGILNLGDNPRFISNRVTSYGSAGGGIYSDHNNVTMGNNAVFENNFAENAGGAIRGFNVAIGDNCSFNNNSVNSSTNGHSAGAIYSDGGNITIGNYARFVNNFAPYIGGAIYMSGSLANSNLIIGNKSYFANNSIKKDQYAGGAIAVDYSDITIGNDAQFINNTAGTFAGAIFNVNKDLTIGDNCSFINNTAANSDSNGGALAVIFGNLIIGKNSTFWGNVATYAGGAIYTQDADILIGDGGTLAYNRLTSTGWAYGAAIYSYAKVTMHNCIIIANIALRDTQIHVGMSTSNLDGNWWGHNVTTYTLSPYECKYTNLKTISEWLILNLTNSSAIVVGDNELTVSLIQVYNNTTQSIATIDGSKLPQNVPVTLTTSSSNTSAANTVLINGVGKTNCTVNSFGNDTVKATVYINSTSINFTVDAIQTTTSSEDVSAYPGDNVSIPIVVLGGDGFAISGNVSVALPDGSVLVVEVVNGSGLVNWTVPDNFTVGNYTVVVVYSGNNKYESSNGSSVVSVIKLNSVITGDNVTAAPGDNISIPVDVVGEDGRPISGNVSVALPDGSVVVVEVVNGSGLVNWTVPDNFVIGNYSVNIIFSGNNKYEPSNNSDYVNVIKLNSTTTMSNVTADPGDNISIPVDVVGEDGRPITGNVSVALPDGSVLVVEVVNGSGLVNWTVPNNFTSGNYSVEVDFAGNNRYYGSNSSFNNSFITINPTPGPIRPNEDFDNSTSVSNVTEDNSTNPVDQNNTTDPIDQNPINTNPGSNLDYNNQNLISGIAINVNSGLATVTGVANALIGNQGFNNQNNLVNAQEINENSSERSIDMAYRKVVPMKGDNSWASLFISFAGIAGLTEYKKRKDDE